MSEFIQIEKDNFLKAHREGCLDVKKGLETLCPKVFEQKFPCLMKSDNAIILALNKEGNNLRGYWLTGYQWDLGHYSEMWVASEFTPIQGIKEIG